MLGDVALYKGRFCYSLLRNYFFTRALSITYGSTVPYRFDPRIAGWLL
jgi:hypothetical protein